MVGVHVQLVGHGPSSPIVHGLVYFGGGVGEGDSATGSPSASGSRSEKSMSFIVVVLIVMIQQIVSMRREVRKRSDLRRYIERIGRGNER
jgi:hypothetical protein